MRQKKLYREWDANDIATREELLRRIVRTQGDLTQLMALAGTLKDDMGIFEEQMVPMSVTERIQREESRAYQDAMVSQVMSRPFIGVLRKWEDDGFVTDTPVMCQGRPGMLLLSLTANNHDCYVQESIPLPLVYRSVAQ